MTAFSAIDLDKLPASEVVETLDFEIIYADMLSDLQARWSGFTAEIESEPAVKILEVAAEREINLRARINDAARAVMLAFASRGDLDQVAANFNVGRDIADPGDPDALPPIPPTFESDDRLRQRTQLKLEGISTAGSIGSYIFHSLAADPRVKDVDVQSPSPGEVVVTVLSNESNGSVSGDLREAVEHYLNAEDIRPLTDHLTVNGATIIEYDVVAELFLFDGPDSDVVLQSAQAALQTYLDSRHRLGHDIVLSGIFAALHQPGVQRVELTAPPANIAVAYFQAPWNTNQTVTLGGMNG